MYKVNQYIFDFSVGILILSCIFIKNVYLYLIISIIFLIISIEKKNFKLALITLFIGVFNSFCGKLLVFSKILLFFDIFLWKTQFLSEKDCIVVVGDIFDFMWYKKMIIYMFSFKNKFVLNSRKYYGLKDRLLSTHDDILNSFDLFEQRLYFNVTRTRNLSTTSYDIISLAGVLMIFIFSIYL